VLTLTTLPERDDRVAVQPIVPGAAVPGSPVASAPGSNYIIPPNTGGGGTGAASSAGINAATPSQPREWQTASIAAIGSVIPLIYGDYYVGAKYLDAVQYSSATYLCILWALGPVVGVQEIVDSNGDPFPAGITIRHYDGTQTEPDARFKTAYQSAKSGKVFNSALHRRCYSVAEVPNTSQADPSNFVAKIRGMKLYDPRNSAHDLNTPATWAWSQNPALALADFISNSLYGWDKKIDWESVKDAADYCDEIVNGAPRWTINYAIQERLQTIQLVELLRAQAHVYLNRTHGIIRMMVDRPRDSVYTFDNIEKGIVGTPRPTRRGVEQSPTVVNVTFSDNTIKPPQDMPAFAYMPGTLEGTVRWSESQISMPMINNHNEAQRFAVEQLLKLQHGNLELDLECRDIGLVFEAGDVVTIPYPEFPEGKPFIVCDEPEKIGLGKYRLNCVEYQPEMWSNDVASQPTYPDTTLPDPSEPPTPENLAVEERLVFVDDAWTSALVATWARNPDWSYRVEYEIELYCDDALIERTTTPIETYQSPTVIEGEEYVLRVSTKTRTFFSAWATATVTALGKYLPPSDVEAYTEVLDCNGTVHLEWLPAHDIDPITYQVRRLAAATAPDWGAAEIVASTADNRVTLTDQEAGEYIYLVKALDSVGNFSVNACAALLTVHIDTDTRFVDEIARDVDEAINVTPWWIPCDPETRWTSDRGEPLHFGHADPDHETGAFDDLADAPFALPVADGASQLTTETWDVGIVVSGDWRAFGNVSPIGDGNLRFVLELSNDKATWRAFVGNFYHSAAATNAARYARVRVVSDGAYTLTGKPFLALDPVPRIESGRLNVGARGIYTARTSGRYSGYVGGGSKPDPVDLVYTGAEPYTPERDSIIRNADGTMRFDVYLRDASGRRVTGSAPVTWTFRGV